MNSLKYKEVSEFTLAHGIETQFFRLFFIP